MPIVWRDTCTLDKLNVPCRGDSGSREEACPSEGPSLSKVVEPPFGREVVVEVVEEVGGKR